jgi:hypothetical protein
MWIPLLRLAFILVDQRSDLLHRSKPIRDAVAIAGVIASVL